MISDIFMYSTYPPCFATY